MSICQSHWRLSERRCSRQHRLKLGFGRAFPVGRNRDESAYFTASFKGEPAILEARTHQEGGFRYHLEDRPYIVADLEPAHVAHDELPRVSKRGVREKQRRRRDQVLGRDAGRA